jgi:hypothetical protein
MKTTKPTTATTKATTTRKPEGLPKIVLGAGRNLAYISDTLFDEDLKL